ncbi:hypothetical protein B0H11DRAFT_498497 [Mycena galericulata]|nr:hypothetical protein B0H11DRAFT_498497 [Mycena galericulata]
MQFRLNLLLLGFSPYRLAKLSALCPSSCLCAWISPMTLFLAEIGHSFAAKPFHMRALLCPLVLSGRENHQILRTYLRRASTPQICPRWISPPRAAMRCAICKQNFHVITVSVTVR